MAETADPNSSLSSVRSSPKDIQLMASILKEMGISDYEPRVLNQMLEFSYRYLTTILDDAYLYSTHAKKKCVDSEDVKLAVNLYQERVLAVPPAREVILDVAKQRNSMPLPQIKTTAGLRLPPDRHSLTACNYRLKSKKRSHAVFSHGVSHAGNVSANLAKKINVSKPSLSIIPKGNTNLSPAITKPIVSISKPAPTPIIKFSDGKAVSTASLLTSTPTTSAVASSVSQLLMPTIGMNPVTSAHILLPTMGVTTSNSNQLLMPSMGITTTSATQILMPTVGVSSMSTPQINMPTVVPVSTEITLPTETVGTKSGIEEDDNYDIE